ncbi:hypothetical protein BDB00DRAFT_870507 [Zychaea mexicana]|uniref:uncharacterized protein n=1 Tax=Zychaea mexicana TaxID=64656 RepID=UPI0022FDEC23|nr:uncharacterized protein BDB00DRAFT_870507 [Zychaea mexicana]KAI9495356.1 hypothetical protein BDB00DRAFT_870507 [Zychaea mexicana]
MPSSFRIVVAADDTLASHHALAFAIDLCSKIPDSVLQVIHAVGLNAPGTSLLGSLDRTNNMEIQAEAKNTEKRLRQALPEGTELVMKEAYEPVQDIIAEFVNQNPPDMFVVGSSNRTGLER